ncbi:insulinase family protein [Altererythrobacter sp. RZ02]|uniref:Insulinase family protein n=1 Tax=Pontixanthobacter rizhaonensis TaxID=2730337 RepID=A0A848QKM3_9SPHN|nr:pitrilysin family protein [Pontixanthobacter rizhaonensis]NMW30735.1 insulinase family protein [Pontixanthobacter rizhaonensis]
MHFKSITRWATTSALVLSLAATPALAQNAPPTEQAVQSVDAAAPAPVSELIDAVSIPYDQFELANGLTVLVHEDRKAPVVGVSVWYNVGSKHEPKGKTGFAHLFEHLMFNGSENAPGDFFEPMQQIGATDLNGTTWFDRTNYFQTVPTGALDRTLMLESDRMGYLLGAVTQEKLDNQIGVVQNEKRQGDNQPYGLVEYEQLENLYPSGHPYHHSTIGSMDDLSSATLDDVKQWFRDNYGPNNAVLVLAGDIDTATAKAKVTKWFGAIKPGPETPTVNAPVPTLDEAKSKTIYDKVATPRIYRMWAVPGLDNPDNLPLAMGATVLGGLASSRLDDALVRGKGLAVRVVARADIFAQAGQFIVYADAKPGVDTGLLAAALDEEIAKFMAEGPTDAEIQRATTVYAAGQIRGLEQVGGFSGKAPVLAQGLLYEGSPAAYKSTLKRAAALTPAEVQQTTAKWLSRPVFELIVEPGDRQEGGENRAGFVVSPEGSGRQPAFYINPVTQQGSAALSQVPEADRSELPPIGELKALDFPTIERATLSNGMKVFFARRDAVPTVSVRVSFDAGYAADPENRLGLHSLMLSAMDEGTSSLTSSQLAVEREKLGANIFGSANADTTFFGMDAVTPNLQGSLNLLADYIRNPAFDETALERVRAQQLTRITGELNSPAAIGQRVLAPILFGPQHPYGNPPSGTGSAEVVAAVTREELFDFHRNWLRPDLANVFVVGNTTLADAVAQLEASFGDWAVPEVAAPVKSYDAPIPAPQPKIILVNRPNSPQSIIFGARVLDQKGTDDLTVMRAANEVFGGGFLSRINMNLRETKGWSYGVRSLIQAPQDRTTFLIYAPVQADRTGDSVAELRKDLTSYVSGNGVTEEELTRLINGNVRELPGQFETSGDVLGGLVNIVTFERPDDYYETLAKKYSALTTQQLDAAASQSFKGDDLVFVIVGDAEIVRPQLDALGLPVEVRGTPSQ